MRRWSLVGAWLLVLALASTLTWQVVSAADDRVSDRPVPLNVAAPALASTSGSTTLPTAASSTSTLSPGSSTGLVDTTSTTSASSSTATSAPQATSPTTTVAWKIATVNTVGGTVVVSYRPGEVTLVTATPAPGFRAEIDKYGPPTVEIEFESEVNTVEVRAEWSDGDLHVQTNVSGED